MIQHFAHKWVAFEATAHRLEVGSFLCLVAIDSKARLSVQIELFLRIVVEHFVERNHSIFPCLDQRNQIIDLDFFDWFVPIFQQLIVSPSPLVIVIISVQLFETVLNVVERKSIGSDVVHQTFHLVLRHYQARKVAPIAQSRRRSWTQTLAHLFHGAVVAITKAADERVSEEFHDGYAIEFDAFAQRRIANFAIVVRIDLRVFARNALQLFQHLHAAHHLLNGVRTEQVEIDLIDFVAVLARVAFGPFLCIAHGADAAQIHGRHKVTLRGIFYQIGEWQIAGVAVVGVAPHHQSECANTCWPQQIRVASGFAAALSHALMNWAKFVHVIALVRARTSIQKREHARNEQRRFVVRNGVRTSKNGGRLAVHALAIGKKERIERRIVLVHDTALSHETARNQRAIGYRHARRENEIFALHARTDFDGRFGIAIERTIFQFRCAANLGIIANAHIFQHAAVDYSHIATNFANGRFLAFGISIDAFLQIVDHRVIVAIKRENIGQMRRKSIENGNFATAALVHHRHTHTVAKGAWLVNYNHIGVFDVGVVTDVVIGYVVVNFANADIVIDRNIVQPRFADARMRWESARQKKSFLESSETDIPREFHFGNMFGRKAIDHFDVAPIVGSAAVCLQLRNLLSGKFSVHLS